MSNFFKNIHPLLRRGKRKDEYDDSNFAVLNALNYELTQAEQETISSKIHSSLESATGEFLDAWGAWFGVYRKDGWTDEYYRKRIIRELLLKRGTVPAIIEALVDFLEDNEATVTIYEPWRNVFYTNKSDLNGEDHLMGYYYRFAIIDISIDRPFPPEIVEVIQSFKPAGVLFYIRLDTSTNPNTQVVDSPYVYLDVNNKTEIEQWLGLKYDVRGRMSLADQREQVAEAGVFHTNNSDLNGEDVLSGSFDHGRGYLHLASTGMNLGYNPTRTTMLSEVKTALGEANQDFYVYTKESDSLSASFNLPAIGLPNELKDTAREFTSSREFINDSTWDCAPFIQGKPIEQIYTCSFEIKNAQPNQQIQFYFQNGSGSRYIILSYSFDCVNWTRNERVFIPVTTEYQKVKVFFTVRDNNLALNEARLAFFGTYDSGNIMTIKNLKFSVGIDNGYFTKHVSELPFGTFTGDIHSTFDVGAYVDNYLKGELAYANETSSSTREALLSLLADVTLSTRLRAQITPSEPLGYAVSLYDFTSNSWHKLVDSSIALNYVNKNLPVNGIDNYLSDTNLMYIKYSVQCSPTKEVPFDIDMLNVTFNKRLGDGYEIGLQSIVEALTETPVNTMTLSKSTVTIGTGETTTLSATLTPATASVQTVEWSIEDSSIATVNASGKVTGVSEGRTTLTAYADDKRVIATCEINVVIRPTSITLNSAIINFNT